MSRSERILSKLKSKGVNLSPELGHEVMGLNAEMNGYRTVVLKGNKIVAASKDRSSRLDKVVDYGIKITPKLVEFWRVDEC